MNDPELKALADIAKALESLDEEQQANVLLYVNARYGGESRLQRGRRLGEGLRGAAGSESQDFENIGEFVDAANPSTQSEQALVVAYWLQAIEGGDDFEAATVSRHLRDLGYTVTNITRSFDALMEQRPRLVIQLRKSGNTKQARKKYKVTREGIKRVQSMLEQSDGGDNGE